MKSENYFIDTVVPRVRNVMEKAIDILSVLLLSSIFVLGLAQVFWRWILKDPIVWSEKPRR